MPSSSRSAWPLHGALLNTRALYPSLPDLANGATWVENNLFGATITAAADTAHARVRVDVYWPPVTIAEVYRVHEDGSEHLVRGGDPALVCTNWARWDYEAPLDQTFTYRVTDGTASWASEPVTLESDGQAWLGHPHRPYLNRPVNVREMPPRQPGTRRGIARPLDRPDPIVVHQTRQTDTGSVVLRADWDDVQAIRAMLADGAPVLLRLPAAWGGEALFISVDVANFERQALRLGSHLTHFVTLPFDVVTRPDGAELGGDGESYDDLADAYHTYNALAAGEPSYVDLAMSGF